MTTRIISSNISRWLSLVFPMKNENISIPFLNNQLKIHCWKVHQRCFILKTIPRVVIQAISFHKYCNEVRFNCFFQYELVKLYSALCSNPFIPGLPDETIWQKERIDIILESAKLERFLKVFGYAEEMLFSDPNWLFPC